MNIHHAFHPCRLAAIALACLITTCAQAGTAGVANGDFNSDLSGWILAGTPFPAWSMLDYAGNSASGSAKLFNTDALANVRVYPLRQCLVLFGPGAYTIEADGLLSAGHVGGRLVLSYGGRVASDCSGGYTFIGGRLLESNGAWVHVSSNISLNPGLNYIEVNLGIEKDAGGGMLEGYFDAVHMFDRDRIFSNGFEAPDLPLPSF